MLLGSLYLLEFALTVVFIFLILPVTYLGHTFGLHFVVALAVLFMFLVLPLTFLVSTFMLPLLPAVVRILTNFCRVNNNLHYSINVWLDFLMN